MRRTFVLHFKGSDRALQKHTVGAKIKVLLWSEIPIRFVGK